MKTAIVCGGVLEEDFIKEYLDDTFEYLIAADRGLVFFEHQDIVPDLLMGDFDSVPAEVLDRYQGELLKFQPMKDETDTELAILEAIKRGATEIHLLGATGGRLDHFMGTMKNLGLGLEQGVKIYLVDSENRICMIGEGETVLEKARQFGKYFSIIPYEDVISGLSIRGAVYDVEDFMLSGFITRGVSNQMKEDTVTISIKTGKAYLMESRE